MIKGLILDVDGVLLGGKKGFNWPVPNIKVINALKELRQKGMVISLCTGKATFAINEIVELAHLDNIHIGDGGAIVADILNKTIIKQHIISTPTAVQVIESLLSQNIYTEIYTQEAYYVQKNQIGEKTKKHKAILYKEPILIQSLVKEMNALKVIKIMPVVDNENQKKVIIELFKKFQKKLSLQWGVHPRALPYQFGIITVKGISKKHAAKIISRSSKIPLEEMLGVGDGMTDWNFMKICGYAGAMGNATQELKDRVILKKEKGFIGKTVDENGLLNILNHFGLINNN